jgi:radical SAM enzyme (TIGR01210 family)
MPPGSRKELRRLTVPIQLLVLGVGRISHFSEGGFPSGWSADILVRSLALRNTEADKNVRAPKNGRCADRCPRLETRLAFPHHHATLSPDEPSTGTAGILASPSFLSIPMTPFPTSPPPEAVEHAIAHATALSQKDYRFDDSHDPRQPAHFWFQESTEGLVLFIVFYTQACRYSRCLGCNLPSRMSRKHVDFRHLMAQIDFVFAAPAVTPQAPNIRKVIVSNNGSVLDEITFSSTALIYLIAKLNLHFPNLAVLAIETRVEYVDELELEFIARALTEGDTPTTLEIAVGFEAFDNHIRNEVFRKALDLDRFDDLCRKVAHHKFRLKCYFMQKPVPGLSDDDAVRDVQAAIDYLSRQAEDHHLPINLHLNPTYAAAGTPLETSFRRGDFQPPTLRDVARAILHAEHKPLSVYIGLSDEDLACPGGSFLRPADAPLVPLLESFNRTQDYNLLRRILAFGEPIEGQEIDG